ncbi:MAG: aldehyde dehydrogenase [Deltaproteobacteria bacterium]|nr:aldehyde dehydrogenase [Deltaproteobacteria bacterium]
MRYAETGYNLEIDLTRGTIERVLSDPEETELYLGGLGTTARIFWERVPPEVDAFSPDNLLIFSAGLLCGTLAIGCNRTIVTTISPLTKLLAFSMMGGFWAPELKYAGYDKVILRGQSPELVYLWIHNEHVEIRDASRLRGKGAIETAELIQQELKEPRAQIAAIGLAGENRVYFASIEQGRSSASRGGIGAVMGDKRVKAIAVRGTQDVHIARPAEYLNLCDEVMAYIKFREENPIPGVVPIHAVLGSPQEMAIHDEKWHLECFSWGNARTRRKGFWTEAVEKEFTDTLELARTRLISCFNCPLHCGATISMPGLPTYMMKCFTKLTYLMAAYSDLDFGLRIAQRATEYGVDGYSTPQVIAFALELYEDGILLSDDMGEMPADTEGRFYYLLDRIVRREGIGDILANGTHKAARQIGRGAEAYAHNNIKRQEQAPLKLGMLNPVYFLMYCTGEKLNITQIEGQFPQAPYADYEDRVKFVEDWFQVPHERFKHYFLDWNPRGENSNPPKFFSAGAGNDMDEEKLSRAAKRYRTLIRAINISRGMRRKDERPPEDHWKRRFPELEEKLLDTYYNLKGWNKEGIPTRETLHELGLDDVAENLMKRGILNPRTSAGS